MAFNPTLAQSNAIKENGNILVSAAAGSGKTAVLVERVITKLCDKKNPIRADELLIVTFTNAAAAEMRTRIEKRIEEEVKNDPENVSLLLQKHLLANAKICTIDSFCIDLVRENFDKLDISPDFKIGEEAVLSKINQDVIYSIINRYFNEKDPVFFQLLDIVGSEFDEKNFAELVLSVYEYSRQLPFPTVWFNSILAYYDSGRFTKNNVWYKYAFEKAKKCVFDMKTMIANAVDLVTNVEDAANAYLSAFLDASNQITRLDEMLETGDWDNFYTALNNFSPLRLPTVRGLKGYPEVNAAKDIYKYLSEKASERIKKLFYADFNFINNQFNKIYPALELFIDILKEFEQKVFEEYKANNIFTFHNTEHLALKLLCKDANTPTDFAAEIFKQYKEVMVDEYQDTNDLQNMLFYVLSGFDKRLFAVGDVKQSIYGFRGANPLNFLNRKNSYVPLENAGEDSPKKIILGNNFRSKDEICDFVNYFFKNFMQSFTGSIVYDEEDMLIPTAKFPETKDLAVNMNIIDTSESDCDALALEARRIAEYINETINGQPCIKLDDQTLRKTDYRDFTILLRSVANKAPALVNELKKLGIPVNLSITEYAQSTEIMTFLSLLKVIDNPQTDIELLTVMMSPIFGFTPDEMAKIRAEKKQGNLYSAVIFCANSGNEHCNEFLNKIKKFRQDSITLTLPKFISKLLVNTEYLNIAAAMSDGEQRRNNLLLLCDIAEQFDSSHTATLSSFIKYVNSQTKSVNSNGSFGKNAVNIMSIHASKGLQFPICIIASTSTRFNDAELRNPAAFSTKYGFGLKYFDEDEKQKFTTISREVILDDIKNTALEEELRLLYVAMTRAQDKLLFLASYKNPQKVIDGFKNLILASQNEIDYNLFSRTKSYADWLIIALLLHPCGKILLEAEDKILPQETISKAQVRVINGADLPQVAAKAKMETKSANEDLSQALKERLDYVYPYDLLKNVQSKISVSVLANKAESDKYAFTSKPSFMTNNGISGAGYGTAMHKIMEYFDFSNYKDVNSELERLCEWQFITEEEKDAVSVEGLQAFFESNIFARIKAASRVEREMRFITEILASKIEPELKNSGVDEEIIVQGAVDVCFIENNELVILDFKTDRVEDINQLAETYGEQLSIYALACEKIFGLKVKEKVIYSFAKSDTVTIK